MCQEIKKEKQPNSQNIFKNRPEIVFCINCDQKMLIKRHAQMEKRVKIKRKKEGFVGKKKKNAKMGCNLNNGIQVENLPWTRESQSSFTRDFFSLSVFLKKNAFSPFSFSFLAFLFFFYLFFQM